MKKTVKILIAVLAVLAAVAAAVLIIFSAGSKINTAETMRIIAEKAGIESTEFLLPETLTDKSKNLTKAELYALISDIFFGGEINELLCYVSEADLRSESAAKTKDAEEILNLIMGEDITAAGGEHFFTAADAYDKRIDGNLTVIATGKLKLSGIRTTGKIIVLAENGAEVTFEKGTTANGGIFVQSFGECSLIGGEEAGALAVTTRGNVKIKGDLTELNVGLGSAVELEGDVVSGMVLGTLSHTSGAFTKISVEGESAELKAEAVVTGTEITFSPLASGAKATLAGKTTTITVEAPSAVINIKAFSEVGTLNLLAGTDGTRVVIEKRAVTGTMNTENSAATIIDNRTPYDGRR